MPPNSHPSSDGSHDFNRGPLQIPVAQALLHRRIVMNPPESFIVAAAAANPPNQQVAGPIAIGQGGQAVMIAANSGDGGDDDSQVGQIVVSGSVLQVEAPTTTATAASTTSDVDTSTAEPTSTDSSTTTTFSITTTTPSNVPSTTTMSNAPPSLTSISSNTMTVTTSSASVTAVSSVSMITSVLTLTSSIAVSSSSQPASSTSTIRSISSASSASTSTSTAGTGMHHFLHSTPFYLLLILGALLLLAILATSFSWMVRHSCFPCCRPEVDDEGLNDLVQSFHPPSRSSTIRRMSLSEKTFDETALGRRSSLFATEGKSPFLHSGTSELGQGDFGLPIMAGLSGFGRGSIKVPTPAHLYGETGPLEVRNAMPGDVEREDEEHGPMHGTPRFLGLDGTGLDVPWSRQSSGIGLGIQTEHDNVHLTDPYLSPPDARDYLGPPFPSPPETVVDEHSHSNPTDPTTSTATSSPASPQRAGTWASNLRSTLFAAISAARAPTKAYNDDDEDKFTRTVLPLHRASTRRAAFPIVVEEEQHGGDRRGSDSGGKGGDGYESYRMPESDVEVIGSVFLAPSFSTTSSSSSSSLSSVARPIQAKSKRLPLRGSAGERYKRYYTRSQQSVASTVDEESCAGWSDSEMGCGPSRLAGGERARGVKSQGQGLV